MLSVYIVLESKLFIHETQDGLTRILYQIPTRNEKSFAIAYSQIVFCSLVNSICPHPTLKPSEL